MYDLKGRFIQTWVYGGWIFKVLLAVFLGSLIVSIGWSDLNYIFIKWIGFWTCFISSILVIGYIYSDEL